MESDLTSTTAAAERILSDGIGSSISQPVRYAGAVGATLLGVIVKMALGTAIMPGTFVTAYAAAMFSAWYGGLGPACVATVLSAAADAYFFLSWPHTAAANAIAALRLGLFAVSAMLISWLIVTLDSAHRRAQRVMQTARDELERRVTERTAALSGANRLLEEEIAERQETQARLQDEHNFASAVIDTVAAIVAVVDPQGRIVRVNRAFERIIGYTLAEVKDKHFWELGPFSNGVGVARDLLARLIAGEATRETAIITRDGRRVLIAWSNTFLYKDGAIQYVIGTGIDVTERRRAERELRHSEERFAGAFNCAPIGMTLVGLDGRPLQINQALCEILGYPYEELRDKPVAEVMLAEDYPAALQDRDRLLAGEVDGYRAERRYKHKSGRIVWLHTAVSLVRGRAGAALYLVSHLQDVTESRRAMEAVRESERQFRTLAETLTAAIFIFQGTALLYVNPAAEAFTGYSSDELRGMTFWDVIHPDFRELVKARGLARQRGETVAPRYEVKIVTKDGEERWMDFSAGAIDFGGAPAVLGTALNITERKRAQAALQAAHDDLELRVQERTAALSESNRLLREEIAQRRQAEAALRESEGRFREMADTAPVLIWMSGPDGRCDYFNRRWLEFTGRTLVEELGDGWSTGVHRDDRARVLDTYRTAFTGRDAFTMEYRLRHRDGTYRWILDTGIPRIHDGGGFVGYIGSSIDIDDRKRIEEELRRSEERFRAIFDQAAVGVSLMGTDGAWLLVNQRMCQLLGYTREELLQHTFRDVTHPDDLERSEEYLRRVNANALDRYATEKRYLRKDGSVLWVNLTATVVRDAIGQPQYGLAIVEDITDRKRAEEQLEELNQRILNILEGITDGFFALDHHGRFTYINPSAEKVLRRKRQALIGKNMWEEFPEGVGSPFHEQYRRVMSERLPVVTEAYYPPLNRWFKARAYPSEGGMSVLFEDLTERHAAEVMAVSEILRALNAQMSAAAAFPNVAAGLRALTGCDHSSLTLFDESREWATVVAVDQPRAGVSPDTRLRLTDIPGAAKMLDGRPHIVSDLTAEPHSPLVQPIYSAGFRSIVCLPLRGAVDVLGMLTLAWRTPAGTNVGHLPMLGQIADAVALAVEKGQLFEQVRVARERLQALSHRLLEVQEAERHHIARELHDEVGQALTGLKLALDPMLRLPPDDARARLSNAQVLLNDLLTRVRDLSLDLRPAMLDDLGLLPALLWLFGRYTAQTNVHVSFEHRAIDRRFAAEVETSAYRIVQEALTNVARHADVDAVTVRAWADETTLGVQIVDAGKGFDPAIVLATAATSGVAGMRERAILLEGHLSIESAPGRGTRVAAELPLRTADAREVAQCR